MLYGFVSTLVILAARMLECIGLRGAGDSTLRVFARALPEMKHALLSHLAFRYEMRGNIGMALELLVALGPPSSEPGFYYVELGNLYEMERKLDHATEAYRRALVYKEGFTSEFVRFVEDKLSALE